MDVPIALGVLVGWLHSAYITAFGALDGGEPEVWFDSVAVLLAALMTARWLQLRGRRRAGDAADRLLALLPRDARKVEPDGSRAPICADLLQPGDRVEVLGGEVVPVDGVVAQGSSSVHRGVLTGESRPEKITVGQEIHAGTTNLGSPLEIIVSAAGAQTRVGRLLAWIEGESRRRAPLLQKVDRWGGLFVLTVLIVSALTLTSWSFVDPNHALRAAVAVLVISCPCALGMATPLSLMVAVGQAARRGVFIKHDDVLEKLAEVTHVVLDKTGTLTEGQMSVVKVEGDEGTAHLAARLEAHSQHPIARALVAWAQELRVPTAAPPQDIEEVAGAGLRGTFFGAQPQRVAVGKAAWILGEAADPAQKLRWEAEVARLGEDGLTPVLVSVDGEVRAALGLGDPLRASSEPLIRALQGRGVRPILLSGDDPRLVERTAARLGIEPQDAKGGVSPEEKRAFVEALKADPKAVVMMVGDGVNDAAALQAAHVGVAVHGGAQASLVAADIFTTRPGLDPVLELLEGSKEVLKTVRRGLALSAGYNLVGMSLAAFGLAGPLLGAIAMPISSLAVVASSLSQRSFRPPRAR
jgi:Cu2+-exporting ATPase